MADQKPKPPETDAQRRERISAEERAAHARRTMEALERRFGRGDE
jgi:hypothetical protein